MPDQDRFKLVLIDKNNGRFRIDVQKGVVDIGHWWNGPARLIIDEPDSIFERIWNKIKGLKYAKAN